MALALTACAAPMLFISCTPASDTSRENDTSAPHSTADADKAPDPITTVQSEVNIKLRVGSYNIKHGADANGDISVIAETIKNAGLDICGVQEVDYETSRCGGIDQPAELASASGLEYYRYAPAIDYQGGKYGTLILSRYPIESFEYTLLPSGSNEQRAVGHAVINLDGTKIDFFNTHLSYESVGLRIIQFRELRDMLSECDHYILTADFNTDNFSEFAALNYGSLVNNDEHRFVTFPGHSSAIDNIVLSDKFEITNTSTLQQSHSDHYMLYSDLLLSFKAGE